MYKILIISFVFRLDIVREILETRAEIYKALGERVDEEDQGEEGLMIEDIALQEHLKLQAAIAGELGK